MQDYRVPMYLLVLYLICLDNPHAAHLFYYFIQNSYYCMRNLMDLFTTESVLLCTRVLILKHNEKSVHQPHILPERLI